MTQDPTLQSPWSRGRWKPRLVGRRLAVREAGRRGADVIVRAERGTDVRVLLCSVEFTEPAGVETVMCSSRGRCVSGGTVGLNVCSLQDGEYMPGLPIRSIYVHYAVV